MSSRTNSGLRARGDELWVVVARDSTARKFKHEPIMPEAARFQMVEALKPVDRAVLGHEGNIYDILDEIRPDIIAIGYDQVHSEERILAECRKRGLTTKVFRLPKFEGDLVGTRKIVRKGAEWLALQERLDKVEGGNTRHAADPPPRPRRPEPASRKRRARNGSGLPTGPSCGTPRLAPRSTNGGSMRRGYA